jgi:hypothetical protein
MVWKYLRSFARDLVGLGDCVAEENDPCSDLCRHLHRMGEKLISRLRYLHHNNAAAPTRVIIWCEENGAQFVATVCGGVVRV